MKVLLPMNAEDKPWYGAWPKNVPKSIKTRIALHDILERTAKSYPEKVAIAFSDKEITFRDLNSSSAAFATALAAIGVKKRDRVAIFLPNVPQFVITYFATLKIGAVVTTISPLFKEREIEYQLRDSEAATIVTTDSLYPAVQKVWPRTSLKRAIITGLHEYASHPNHHSNVIEENPLVYSFHELLKKNAESRPLKIKVNAEEDLAVLQYTGGTTGTAKGAMLTHANLVSDALAFSAWIKSNACSNETFLAALPLFHIYGMTTSMNVPINLAAKTVLLHRFDPQTALENIQQHKVTVFCGVPTMYSLLLANPNINRYNLTSIRVCISGASPLPPHVQKRFMEISGGFLAEGYGLTEASPVTHCNPVDRTMKKVKVGSIGLPLPDTDARIVDLETGEKTLEAGLIGELSVKGPQVMKGYWKNPDETDLVLHDGWLLTGDIGKMDKDGYFYITDRKKDLIKFKDHSVYPREIEDVIYEHNAVKLCAVIGKPHPIWGEVPKAFIVLKDDKSATESEIMDFIRDKLAPYKNVQEVEFRKDLPLSSAGKVLRRVLREEERKSLVANPRDSLH
jgi:long-chain acyl-CoA synthetase